MPLGISHQHEAQTLDRSRIGAPSLCLLRVVPVTGVLLGAAHVAVLLFCGPMRRMERWRIKKLADTANIATKK